MFENTRQPDMLLTDKQQNEDNTAFFPNFKKRCGKNQWTNFSERTARLIPFFKKKLQ